jgi:putative NIF3 family GTP cyclohydrolase 1 type 2
VNAIALTFDAQRPDVAQIAEGLADALLAHHPLELPEAA